MPLLNRAIRVACSFALALSLTFVGAQPASAQPQSIIVAFSPVPYSFPSGADAEVPLSYNLPQGATWVSLALRLNDSKGKTIVYQSTWIGPQDPSARIDSVPLPLDTENIKPGSYELVGEISAKVGEDTLKGTVSTQVAVYSPDKAPVDVVFIARAATTLLGDANGEYMLDPASHTSTRNEVTSLCDEVITNRTAHLVLAIAPAMLEEWADIARGYTLILPNSKSEVPPTEDVPLAYDLALAKIRQAQATGRLELAAVGYSDPDLSTLVSVGLGGDLDLQYSMGISTLTSLVSTQTISGTVPYRLDAPVELDPVLSDNDLSWTLVSQEYARSEEETAAAGVWRLKRSPSITALVDDAESGKLIAQGSPLGFVSRALERHIDGGAPFVVLADLTQTPPGRATEALVIIGKQPWARTVLAEETMGVSAGEVTVSQAPDLSSPEGYWDTVALSRARSRALSAITVEPGAAAPILTRRTSLIAESSMWFGREGRWPRASEGLAHANLALATANKVLDAITLKIEAVTLSKDAGEIPLVVSNGTDLTLKVDVVPVSKQGLTIPEANKTTSLTLRPNDNYMTIPVSLDTAASGELSVRVMAGDEVIAEQTVAVKGSLLDRVVFLASISAVLLGLLLYIRHRVRSVEQAASGKNMS